MSLLYTHCADNHPTDSPIEWCFSDFDVMSHAPTTEARRVEQEKYWEGWGQHDVEDVLCGKGRLLAKYFNQPTYRLADGRPVLYRGNAESLLFYQERFNLAPDEVLWLIGWGAKRAIYWVATNTPSEYCERLKQWGFSAYTEYQSFSGTWESTMELYRIKWREGVEMARRTGLKYWPAATVGFDSRAWYDYPYRFIPTPEQFEAHIREVRKFTADNADATDGHLNINNLSEHGEGSVLEPEEPGMLHDGREMLDALIRAVAA